MLAKLSRDGLLFALVLYLFEGGRQGFDVTHWPESLLWGIAGVWAFVMVCLAGYHRERAKRSQADG